jgi:hypothetical protein
MNLSILNLLLAGIGNLWKIILGGIFQYTTASHLTATMARKRQASRPRKLPCLICNSKPEDEHENEPKDTIELTSVNGLKDTIERKGERDALDFLLWWLLHVMIYCDTVNEPLSLELDFPAIVLSSLPLLIPYSFYNGRPVSSIGFFICWRQFCLRGFHLWVAGLCS